MDWTENSKRDALRGNGIGEPSGDAALSGPPRHAGGSLLEGIRFAPEGEKLAAVVAQYDLEKILAQFEQSQEMGALRQHLLGTQMRLSAMLSPRLFGLLDEVQKALELDAAVELFVAADPGINAFAVHSLDESPHVVSMTSGLVEKMDDAELRFVLGHELGHLAYQHYRARLVYPAIGTNERGESKMPLPLQRKLGRCARWAEFSADRAGFLTLGGDLKPVVSAFFKMASGLGPEHLNFDISAFLGQLDEIEKVGQGRIFCGFSHPLTPIRVRALQLFAEAGGSKATPTAREALDAAALRLAKLMDFQVTDRLSQNGRDLVMAGGILVAASDGENISRDEFNALVELLLPVIEDPEEKLQEMKTVAQARETVIRSAAWLKENAGREKFNMFAMLTHIAAVDGVLKGGEEAVLLSIAEMLAIPHSVARETILAIVAQNLQMQQGIRMPML